MNESQQQFVYGPVPSRRLGQSLGVSPIPPKTCNYSCVYCQIGRTTHYTNKRQSFFEKETILDQVFETIDSGVKIDYITFVGEGEPTLSKDLGWLIEQIKNNTTIPTAVITNGALLIEEQVRNELRKVDVILPTLDATKQKLFKKINRPVKGLKIKDIIEGFRQFRKNYSGEIWMEVMLVKGLNDTKEVVDNLEEVLNTLSCDRVYVNIPIRPPAETWVKCPDNDRVLEICKQLGAENISHYESVAGFHIDKAKKLAEELVNITTRHPLREEQILKMVDSPPDKVKALLERLSREGKLRKVVYNERIFWINASSKIKSDFGE
jgi:wyosine [tRNA(Phe)-imidazoG37] synthetase (radical SAM superfamily)